MVPSRGQPSTNSVRPDRVIGYVGTVAGGQALGQWGSGWVLTAAGLPQVKEIDVFCPSPPRDSSGEALSYPSNVKITTAYRLDETFSLWGLLLRLRAWQGDLLVFSSNTTAYGRRTIPNVVGLALPVLARRLLRRRTVLVYHSSVLTSDVERLGYTSRFDRLREWGAALAEKWVFGLVPTYVLLELYRERVAARSPRTRVGLFTNEYLEAVPTIYLNGLERASDLPAIGARSKPSTVLLHGFWGPQKDLEGALRTLRGVRAHGLEFQLVLSGSANPHFPEYESRLSALCEEYRELISRREPHPSEARMASLLAESDVLLLPYHASGGQSGVMEMASAFDLPTVCIDFPEYREKARTKPNVILVAPEGMGPALEGLLRRDAPAPGRDPHPREKLAAARDYVATFLESALEIG